MASSNRTAANRRNAQKSTGPRTEAGKRRVSANAVKHGFYSTRFTIPGEDQEQFHAIHAEFLAEHRPVGPVETSLVNQLTLAHVRIMRYHSLIAVAFSRRAAGLKNPGDPPSDAEAAFNEDMRWNREIVHLDRIVSSAERSFLRILSNLRRLQTDLVDPASPLEDTIAEESSEPPLPGPHFDLRRSCEPFSKSPEQTQADRRPHLAVLSEMGLGPDYRRRTVVNFPESAYK